MSAFNIHSSIRSAQQRFGHIAPTARVARKRSDFGRVRMPRSTADKLQSLLLGQERPPVRQLIKSLGEYCEQAGLDPPSRASIYNFMARTESHTYPVGLMPSFVRSTLYNLSDDAEVPGHQLAFHCFNYGGLRALCFAAGLPWLDLYQAARMRGWRPKSLGVLRAVLRVRRI